MTTIFPQFRFQLTTIASSAVLIAALCVSASAQDKSWPALLGGSNFNSPNRTTAKYGISYNTRGHDVVKQSRIEKSIRYFENHDAPHLKGEFLTITDEIQEPGKIEEWIVSAYEWSFNKAIACGGKQAEAARKLNPRSLSVVVEDRPFKVFYEGTWQWAGGWYEGRRIRVVNVAIYGLDAPRSSSLRTLPGYLVSEMGRVFGFTSDPSSGCQ